MKEKSKHILIVTSEFPPQPGGIGTHAYHLANALNKEGYTIKVITDQRSLTGEEEYEFDKNLAFSVVRIPLKQQRYRMYVKRIITTLKNVSNASHIIASGKFSLWNVAFVSLLKKRKTIAVVHGSEVNLKSFLLKKTIRFSLKRMDTIVAVSNYTKRLIAHLNKEIIVIPNGIQLENWLTNAKTDIKIQGSPVLTTIGRLSIRKGQLQVIRHLPTLLKTYPNLHYHCFGIATEKEIFIKEAKALGVNAYVTFHGRVTNDELKQFLLKTNVFVMLSTEDKSGDVEGFGIAILEANALGIPAIGSVNSGIEDAIKNNYSGILIDATNTHEFLNAIQTILLSKENYATNSKKWATQHAWSRIIKQYIALLS